MASLAPGGQQEPVTSTHKDSRLTFPRALLGPYPDTVSSPIVGQLKKNTPVTTHIKQTSQKFHLQLPVTWPQQGHN